MRACHPSTSHPTRASSCRCWRRCRGRARLPPKMSARWGRCSTDRRWRPGTQPRLLAALITLEADAQPTEAARESALAERGRAAVRQASRTPARSRPHQGLVSLATSWHSFTPMESPENSAGFQSPLLCHKRSIFVTSVSLFGFRRCEI